MTTIIKKVKCINDEETGCDLKNSQIYEVVREYICGTTPFYELKDVRTNGWRRNRFEDVIEPDFKIGDKVVFVREDYGRFSTWNRNHTIGEIYTVIKLSETERNIYTNTGYFMPAKCFELAPEPKPEPKPQFKVGDWVKVTKEVLPSDSRYVGNIYEIIELGLKADWYILENCPLAMRKDQLELAEEPKPEVTGKFKVGDFVKGIGNRYGVTNSHMTKGVVKYVGDEDGIGVQRLERDGNPISDDIVFDVSEEYFELWEEPKPIVKERTTVKKVRCIDTLFSQGRLKGNQIYEVTEGVTPFGTKYYTIKGVEGTFLQNRFEDVVEEKYPIIEDFFGDTIVFNPPYTIAKLQVKYGPEKGKWFIGKAKCNPSDTYDKWTGFKIAHQRMRESKPCSK